MTFVQARRRGQINPCSLRARVGGLEGDNFGGRRPAGRLRAR